MPLIARRRASSSRASVASSMALSHASPNRVFVPPAVSGGPCHLGHAGGDSDIAGVSEGFEERGLPIASFSWH